MRFHANGPSIPDELLLARDEGRVLFFCGAGVSHARAKLANFLGLAQSVADKLGVLEGAIHHELIKISEEIADRTGMPGLIAADRIFGLLERDFETRHIHGAVAQCLKPEDDADLSAHRILLDLARGPDGKVRLITTNFDLLFEKCNRSLNSWCPPNLPDPNRFAEQHGITHLHGRVNSSYSGTDGDTLVLSSAEFGSAYLSEGWASEFIRRILAQYMVVFVGYSADDPPLRYLLEALSRTSKSKGGLYAFQEGTSEEAGELWRDKGVTAIAYDKTPSHTALWDTLDAWTKRARNPELWIKRTLELGRCGPSKLLPHQRGQIAHIVKTAEGMRKFGNTTRPMPAEWLCVFDSACRYMPPRAREIKDPFDYFGLDDDKAPEPIDPESWTRNREIPDGAWDCFTHSRSERQNLHAPHYAALRGHWAANHPLLSPRMTALASWIARTSHEPITLWWAAGQSGLHEYLKYLITLELRTSTQSSPKMRKAWRLLLEASPEGTESPLHAHELRNWIARDGWSDAVVRAYASINRAYLVHSRQYGHWPFAEPNDDQWYPSTPLSLDVKYPNHLSVEVPNDYLFSVIYEFTSIIRQAAALESEVSDGYPLRNLIPIEPEPGVSGNAIERSNDFPLLILFYVALLKKLIAHAPADARLIVSGWPADDEYVFARLRIWAAGIPEILDGAESGDLIAKLSSAVFWDGYHQRDLLLCLAKRWADFPASTRKAIETKIMRGPVQRSAKFSVEDKAEYALTRMHWLRRQGCAFSFDFDIQDQRLRVLAPQWKEIWGATAATSRESISGPVVTDPSFDTLKEMPLQKILQKAFEEAATRSFGFMERNPFQGISRTKPAQALGAIRRAENQEFTVAAWRTFLSLDSRNADKPRLAAYIALRLCRLTDAELSAMLNQVTGWLVAYADALTNNNYSAAVASLWQRLLSVVQRTPQKPTRTASSGERDWAFEGLNSPVGHLARILVDDPVFERCHRNGGLPDEWKAKAEQLLALPSELDLHAMVMYGHHANRLFWVDPVWTQTFVLPHADTTVKRNEAFWSGFLWRAQTPNLDLYPILKPHLLARVTRATNTKGSYSRIAATMLMSGWMTVDEKTHERLVSDQEMRKVLLEGGNDFRLNILASVRAWVKDATGIDRAVMFLNAVWPRHKIARTSAVSARLCEIVFAFPDAFERLYPSILDLVTRIDDHRIRFADLVDADSPLTERVPDKVMTLLFAVLPQDASAWPYNMDTVLTRIAKAQPALKREPRLLELRRRWDER